MQHKRLSDCLPSVKRPKSTKPFRGGRKLQPFGARVATVERSQPIEFHCPADVRLICLSGTAWITTHADSEDVVLKPGQVHLAAGGDHLFISGIPQCRMLVEPIAGLV